MNNFIDTLMKKLRMSVSTRASAQAPKRARTMPRAEGPYCFWVHNGPILHDLRELARALETMPEKQFAHHVNKTKNDFAAWTNDVLGESACARALALAKTRARTRAALADCLKKRA